MYEEALARFPVEPEHMAQDAAAVADQGAAGAPDPE
jgi:hypothetical protein